MPEEKFRPPQNLPPDKLPGGERAFAIRKIADLQVASVLLRLEPWLAGLSGKVLEVGCGAQPYRHLIPAACEYRALDWEKSGEAFDYRAADTVYYSGGEFPFGDKEFDCLFHTEVIEHVYEMEIFVAECRRVLKPGGRMMMTVPFQARYHYIPYDYWRFTPASLERMLAEAGFTEIEIMPRGNDIAVAAYKVLSLTYRWLMGGVGGKLLGVLSAPVGVAALVVGHVALRANVGSPDDCLGYVVTAKA